MGALHGKILGGGVITPGWWGPNTWVVGSWPDPCPNIWVGVSWSDPCPNIWVAGSGSVSLL